MCPCCVSSELLHNEGGEHVLVLHCDGGRPGGEIILTRVGHGCQEVWHLEEKVSLARLSDIFHIIYLIYNLILSIKEH